MIGNRREAESGSQRTCHMKERYRDSLTPLLQTVRRAEHGGERRRGCRVDLRKGRQEYRNLEGPRVSLCILRDRSTAF